MLNKPMGYSSWDMLYKKQDVETMPWYLTGLDHDMALAVKKYKIGPGKVLDIGAGPGTQAMALAKKGFEVTATDISRSAVAKAKAAFKSQKLNPRFVTDDITRTKLKGSFDLVLDRGCFHVLSDLQRKIYVRNLRKLMRPGAYLLLKTFSDANKQDMGPKRFRPSEIRALFKKPFRVLSIKRSEFKGRHKPRPKALFSVILYAKTAKGLA